VRVRREIKKGDIGFGRAQLFEVRIRDICEVHGDLQTDRNTGFRILQYRPQMLAELRI
jgi:hypothetical protein